VGDPACKKFSEEANETNWDGSVALFEAAEKAGIKRFVFASTCSNYGKMADPDSFVVETSELNPVSLYAELKVKFEKYILEQRKDSKMGSPYKSMQVDFYQRVTGIGITNKNLQVNAS
jgi:nucleoside-diphosphate-sugar epimerase